MTLTQTEIDARMEAYEQARSSLEGPWADTKEEFEAGKVVEKQIRAIAMRWLGKRAIERTD